MPRTVTSRHPHIRRRLVLSAAAAVVLALGTVAPAEAKAYPKASQKLFTDACVESATAQAPQVAVTKVRSYCTCLLGKYESHYSFAQFEAIDRALSQGRKMTRTQYAFATNAGNACAIRLR